MTPYEWAFLECHRLHEDNERVLRETEREAKLAASILELAVASKTADFTQANSLIDGVRARWFGTPGQTSPDDATMAFRNEHAVFDYATRMADGYPDEEELAAFLDEDWQGDE